MNNAMKTFGLLSVLFLLSCNTKEKKESSTPLLAEAKTNTEFDDKAEALLASTLEAHGGELYNTASYTFSFRDKTYSFTNNKGKAQYTSSVTKKGKEIIDVLKNSTFTRSINGKVIDLSDRDIIKYSSSLNSVIYFATLPHKLTDAAVNKSYGGTTTIHGKSYDILEISFQKEGGGKDFDDEFHYWINSETHTIDYLAYNYTVDGGGVRFRAAFNPRTIAGIRFQDYINYKAKTGTPLKDLPKYYEKKELKELSQIILENVKTN